MGREAVNAGTIPAPPPNTTIPNGISFDELTRILPSRLRAKKLLKRAGPTSLWWHCRQGHALLAVKACAASGERSR